MSIYKKLIEIQNKLKAPKSQYNSFGKYNYRNCEDILEAAKPILKEHDCSLFIEDVVEMIGNRYYIKATVHFIDNESGKEITNSAYAREEESRKGMNSDQLTGATSSYARKYALNGMFCIDDSKDSDNAPHKDDAKDNAKTDKSDYKESPLDVKFLEVWNNMSQEQKEWCGKKYPGKYGPQKDPKYFKKTEKEEILKTMKVEW